MATVVDGYLRRQLLDRQSKLEHAVGHSSSPARLYNLLEEVDTALGRLEDGTYGLCETCHEPVECDRLLNDPLVRFCLDHLSAAERDALEQDLLLAARVQQALLPKCNLQAPPWQVCYHYEPAGIVSGDYCDIIDAGDSGLFFMVGDVSGKGVAASMLMAHLHAMFRSLISVGLPLKGMLEHASGVFSESTLPNQYATLVCGRALRDGSIEICNAGHPAPLLVKGREITSIESSNLPVGMFCCEEFSVSEFQLEPGEGLVVYSDGASETVDDTGRVYGDERIRALAGQAQFIDPSALLSSCRDDLAAFRRDSARADDVTLLVLGQMSV